MGESAVEPLKIDVKYQWCANLLRLLEEFHDVGRHFTVINGELAWRDEIPFADQLALAKQVHKSWKGIHGKQSAK